MLGSVTVHYSFLGSPGSVNMADGEFSKEFDVKVDGNSNPQKDRVLFLNLTSVTGSKIHLFVLFVTCSRKTMFYFETHRGTKKQSF